MKILGAGMAGCLAGIINPAAIIYEPRGGVKKHKALLRFRTPQISKVTGIPFKKVSVTKAIWDDGYEVEPAPRHVIRYSQKVSGSINDRSIGDISPCVRWIAPDDFHAQLIDLCGNRISYNCDPSQVISQAASHQDRKIISTLPINVLCNLLDVDAEANVDFNGIHVTTFTIPNCNIYCTTYYPNLDTTIYRASITGDKLIVESMAKINCGSDVQMVFDSFGLEGSFQGAKCGVNIEEPDEINIEQSIGKMVPMDNRKRKKLILDLTLTHGIYSLGRFATWRNILLDDVLNDIYVIRQLINEQHHYDHQIRSANNES